MLVTLYAFIVTVSYDVTGRAEKAPGNVVGIVIYITCRCHAVVVIYIGAVYAPTNGWRMTI